MGRCRMQGKNLAKYGVKIKRKRIEKLKRRKALDNSVIIETVVDSGAGDNVADEEWLQVEMLPDDTGEGAIAAAPAAESLEPHLSDRSRKEKLRRNELPLMQNKSLPMLGFDFSSSSDSKSQRKTRNNGTGVVCARQMSKKRARKMMKVMKRKEKLESAMDVQ
ncbi:unnamed protein product [Gongylonema pulchrum]|uniref:Uncharacterized protein n=1 Tax=Gongylonema pulchrum TaxID=637853 RepID=A0A183EDK1_9BILA|nr:unnamed protein product [Gongylonema pulchrum]